MLKLQKELEDRKAGINNSSTAAATGEMSSSGPKQGPSSIIVDKSPLKPIKQSPLLLR